MKCFLAILFVAVLMFACDKETDPVYDSHLFQALQANAWILDSANVTDSLGRDASFRATDSAKEINQFNSQLYTINNITIKDSDTTILDTTLNQIIYNSPNRIYFYNTISQQITPNHYIDIDTVNADALIVTETDTLKNISRKYYHAEQ